MLSGRVSDLHSQGKKGYRVRKGETFYIKGNEAHYLINSQQNGSGAVDQHTAGILIKRRIRMKKLIEVKNVVKTFDNRSS